MKPAVTYKPGWDFEWLERGAETFLRIVVTTPDAKGRDSVTGLPRAYHATFQVPQPFQPIWLLLLIGDIEDHERREWLRLDGVGCFNPHVYGEPDHAVANRPMEWWQQ